MMEMETEQSGPRFSVLFSGERGKLKDETEYSSIRGSSQGNVQLRRWSSGLTDVIFGLQ